MHNLQRMSPVQWSPRSAGAVILAASVVFCTALPAVAQHPGALLGKDAETANRLQAQIDTLVEKKDVRQAAKLAAEMLGLRKERQGLKHFETVNAEWLGRTLNQLAMASPKDVEAWLAARTASTKAKQLNAEGKYVEAQALYEAALNTCRHLFGEDHPETASGYNKVAFNLDFLGRYVEAQAQHNKELAIRRRLLGEDHPDTAESYNNVAFNLKAQGRYAEAQPYYQQALDNSQRLLGQDHPSLAPYYNNLASNLNAQGKFIQAHPSYVKALNICRIYLGDSHVYTATSFNNVAFNWHCQGKYAEAQLFYQKAHDIREHRLAANHSLRAQSYGNLGIILHVQGKYVEAQAWHEKALDIHKRRADGDSPETAESYNNLAGSLEGQGKYVEAQPWHQEALNIRKRFFSDHHPLTAESYNNLAANLSAQGKYAEAEPLARAAVDGLECARLRATSAGLDRAGFQRTAPRLVWTSTLLHMGRPTEALQVLEGHFGRGLLDEVSARQVPRLTADEQRELDRLNGRLNQLNQEIGSLLGGKDRLQTNREKVEALAQARKDADSQLALLDARLQQKEIYDLKMIQSCIPAGSALVTWLDWKNHSKAARPSGQHWAFLLKAKGEPVVVELKGTGKNGAWVKEDHDSVLQLRTRLRRPPGSETDIDQMCRQLARQRLGPLESHLEDVRHLIVLPAEAMSSIPLETLTDRFVVSYAPSGTMLAKLIQKRSARSSLRSLLAIGDPVFRSKEAPDELPPPPDHGLLVTQVQPDSNAAISGIRSNDVLLQYQGKALRRFEDLELASEGKTILVQVWRNGQTLELRVKPGRLGVAMARISAAEAILSTREIGRLFLQATRGPTMIPLPGTRYEVEAIAAMFRKVDKLLGADASLRRLAALEKDLGQYDVFHFATHGVANPQVALESALILSQTNDDNGRLTAEYMKEHWPLKAELMVLSACDTGLGRHAVGEGYVGFSQALFLAGARSLVLSLWKVDDTATALLMVRFYQNLLGKREGLKGPMAKAQALDEAKRWLRTLPAAQRDTLRDKLSRGLSLTTGPSREKVETKAPYAHPYFWSAFILIGDPN